MPENPAWLVANRDVTVFGAIAFRVIRPCRLLHDRQPAPIPKSIARQFTVRGPVISIQAPLPEAVSKDIV